jgi:hypothetical protein
VVLTKPGRDTVFVRRVRARVGLWLGTVSLDAMTSPPSLRDLYVDPAAAWAFNVPATPAPAPVAALEPSYQWSARPAPNSIFDLSPSLDFGEPATIDAGELAKTIVAAAILQYASTAIANPWEVGKLLLQVQWVPRDAGEPKETVNVEEYENEDAVRLVTTFLASIVSYHEFHSSATPRTRTHIS